MKTQPKRQKRKREATLIYTVAIRLDNRHRDLLDQVREFQGGSKAAAWCRIEVNKRLQEVERNPQFQRWKRLREQPLPNRQ